MTNKWATVTASAALVVAVGAVGAAVATSASATNTKTATSTQVTSLQRQANSLRQTLRTDVASFQKALDAQAAALHSVQSTATAATNANLGYCVTYSSITYASGYEPNGTNGQLLQDNLYYPSDISTPVVSGAGVVSCPSGSFVSVVPTKTGQ